MTKIPYSKEEVEETVLELDEKLSVDPDEIEEELRQLGSYRVPLGDAKKQLLQKFPRSHEDVEYQPFDSFDGERPPPKISGDDWVEYEDTTGKTELRQIGQDLQDGANNIVYCVECEVIGETLRAAQLEAKERLNDLPSWVRNAYLADHVFYVGETARLGSRLQSHAIGRMRESPPPARLTRISHTTAVGVILRTDDREAAESCEETYAANFQDVVADDDSVFVYQA